VATRFDALRSDFRPEGSGAPTAPPTAQSFWSASTSGAGKQTLTWSPKSGSWRIVLMNADGSRGVSARLAIGAELPHLLAIGLGLLAGGGLLLVLSGGGLFLAVRRR
jgi:hypothetical protein